LGWSKFDANMGPSGRGGAKWLGVRGQASAGGGLQRKCQCERRALCSGEAVIEGSGVCLISDDIYSYASSVC
jgi:hypothetical protein